MTLPTIQQSIDAAPKLSELERSYNAAVSRYQIRFEALNLHSPDQLPELEGDALVFTWEGERDGGRETRVIRYGDRVVWKEPGVYEGYWRFGEVLEILKQRYGKRLLDVVPAPSSELYLYGDKLSSPETVEGYRADLQRPGP